MNKRIEIIINKLKIKQMEFAQRIGVSQAYISKLIKDKSEKIPSDSLIKLICKEFNVNENWFRTGEGEMFVQEQAKDLFFALGKSYPDMSEIEKNIMIAYLELPQEKKDVFTDWLKRVIELEKEKP